MAYLKLYNKAPKTQIYSRKICPKQVLFLGLNNNLVNFKITLPDYSVNIGPKHGAFPVDISDGSTK